MVWIPSANYIYLLFKNLIKNETLLNPIGLEGTLDKVKHGIPFHEIPTIWDQVTILFKELVENHYFSNGNKRIGSLIAYIFLYKNGFEFQPEKGEIYEVTLSKLLNL